MRARFEQDPQFLADAHAFYAENPEALINGWLDTFDPRNAGTSRPAFMPMVMFARQGDLVRFLVECIQDDANGLIDKSRDMGATWICVGISIWMWRYWPGSSIGWGSRKKELVDRIGDADSIFEKLRIGITHLPSFLLPHGFDRDKHLSYMRIINPENGSTITGEIGDEIGRGGRKRVYFKDESSRYQHAEKIEAALADNTRVQIDISTQNGVGTIYDRKREAGTIWKPGLIIPPGTVRVLEMDWSDHPLKDRKWYDIREKEARSIGLLHIFRQEVDRDPAASVEGIIISADWVRAAVDAHMTLKFGEDGRWGGALDVADEGLDLNALTFRKGVVLNYAEDWAKGDVGQTTRRAVAEAKMRVPCALQYDSVGIGAGVKSEANRLRRENLLPHGLNFLPWNAGAAVLRPEERIIPGDVNSLKHKDFFANLKAQGWWSLARRFEKTYRALIEGVKYPPAELISLSSKLTNLRRVQRELSQPTFTHDGKLRLLVDKKPDGAKSPNLADSVMMNYFPAKMPMIISPLTIQNINRRGGRR